MAPFLRSPADGASTRGRGGSRSARELPGMPRKMFLFPTSGFSPETTN